MSDTLEICIKQVDKENAGPLVNKLAELIKTGVGMQTKVGCAKFISSLTYSKADELRPYSPKLLAALAAHIQERSPAVRKAFSTATANVAALSPQKSVQKLIEKLIQLYNQPED